VGPRDRRQPKAPRRDLRRIRNIVYEQEAPWRTSLPGRVLTFAAGVLAVLAMAGLFVPHAAVTLYPEAQTQRLAIPVAAGESVRSVSITGEIPAHVISVTVNADQSLAVANQISIPKSKSQGIARFTNLGQGEVNIPVGTIVATSASIQFVTLHETLLPAGADNFVDVPIEALKAGTKSNVTENVIVVVEGPIGLSIKVTNPKPVSGGTDENVIGASDEDRSKLSAVVFDNLSRAAQEQINAQIKPGDLLLLDTLETAEILQEEFDPPAGQAGKTLQLKMKVKYNARYISKDDLNQLSISTLDASIPAGFSQFGSPSLQPLAEPATDSLGITHFNLEVKQIVLRNVDRTHVFSVIAGHSPERARSGLSTELSLRKSPEIIMTPSWWPWLPLIPFNISIEIK
jgi:hypothetical protein